MTSAEMRRKLYINIYIYIYAVYIIKQTCHFVRNDLYFYNPKREWKLKAGAARESEQSLKNNVGGNLFCFEKLFKTGETCTHIFICVYQYVKGVLHVLGSHKSSRSPRACSFIVYTFIWMDLMEESMLESVRVSVQDKPLSLNRKQDRGKKIPNWLKFLIWICGTDRIWSDTSVWIRRLSIRAGLRSLLWLCALD